MIPPEEARALENVHEYEPGSPVPTRCQYAPMVRSVPELLRPINVQPAGGGVIVVALDTATEATSTSPAWEPAGRPMASVAVRLVAKEAARKARTEPAVLFVTRIVPEPVLAAPSVTQTRIVFAPSAREVACTVEVVFAGAVE